MASWEQEYHRTLVHLLIDSTNRELAAAMVDGGVDLLRDGEGQPTGLTIDVPTHAYELVSGNDALKQALVRAARAVAAGHFYDGFGNVLDQPDIRLRVKRMEVEEGWQQIARDLIVNFKGNNQATISNIVARRNRRELLTYNEAGYGSQSEVAIAMELEHRGVLFFPLPFGVRADTGVLHRDHREPDFVICEDGTWGILEVSYHPGPGRYEKDKEKDAWWKKSGILCVEHYPSERCYREPAKVVDEFLTILAKHKR